VEEKLSIAKPLDVEEALMILEDEHRYFLVFRNAGTGELNVIYRKKTGKYGLISP
jgi:putative sigma-54 modulation protein